MAEIPAPTAASLERDPRIDLENIWDWLGCDTYNNRRRAEAIVRGWIARAVHAESALASERQRREDAESSMLAGISRTAASERDALRAAVAELVEALKPFVKLAGTIFEDDRHSAGSAAIARAAEVLKGRA